MGSTKIQEAASCLVELGPSSVEEGQELEMILDDVFPNANFPTRHNPAWCVDDGVLDTVHGTRISTYLKIDAFDANEHFT